MSLQDEREYVKFRDNLIYDEKGTDDDPGPYWRTKLPWNVDRNELADNKPAVLGVMNATKRKLQKKLSKATINHISYCAGLSQTQSVNASLRNVPQQCNNTLRQIRLTHRGIPCKSDLPTPIPLQPQRDHSLIMEHQDVVNALIVTLIVILMIKGAIERWELKKRLEDVEDNKPCVNTIAEDSATRGCNIAPTTQVCNLPLYSEINDDLPHVTLDLERRQVHFAGCPRQAAPALLHKNPAPNPPPRPSLPEGPGNRKVPPRSTTRKPRRNAPRMPTPPYSASPSPVKSLHPVDPQHGHHPPGGHRQAHHRC